MRLAVLERRCKIYMTIFKKRLALAVYAILMNKLTRSIEPPKLDERNDKLNSHRNVCR